MPLVTTGIITAGILAKGLLAWVLSGPAEAAKGAAGDLLENLADKLFQRAPAPLRTALAAAEADILACNSYQGLLVKEWPWVRDTAFTLLRRHNPNPAQVTTQNYDPDTLADRLMGDAGDLLSRFDNNAHQKQACHDVLRILLHHLLNQGDHLTAMEAAWRGEILSRLSEILQRLNDLPNDIALHHLAGLSLLRPNAPEPFRKRRSANILLTARHTDLPLRGRETEMEDLWQWATSRREVAVRLLVGPGGHGKTRLALELCRRLERERGWRTGFAVDQWPALSDAELARIMPPDRPTLIVLDYAAGRGAVLSALARLADNWPENPAFRLLLIEREAGDWWSNCRSLPGAPEHFFADEKICEQVPMRILALPDNGPAEIYADALSVFATLLRRDLATLKSARDWPAELRLPLFARARALLAVEAAETDGLTADNILNQLIDREEVLWRREMHGDGSDNSPAIRSDLDLVRQALTLLTLSSPTSVCDADTLLCRLPRLASHSIETRERFLKALHPLYGDGDLLRGLEPDLLGEHLVWRTVKSPTDPLLIAATGNEASEAQAQTALTILNRLAARKPDAVEWLRAILDRNFDRLAVPAFRVALEQPLPIAAVFRGVMGRLSFEQALTLSPLLPEYTTELLEIAVEVEQRLVDLPLPADASERLQAFRAGRLNNLSIRRSNLGQPAKALAAAEEAVDLYHTLVKTRPEVYLHNFAASLNTLSNHLSYLGHHEDALVRVDQAVALYRTLAKLRPGAFLQDLAMALNNLSSCLSELGQLDKALAAGEEAVDHYRSLAESQTDASRFNLAVSLNTLSANLSKLGQWEKALVASHQAVGHFRSLAETQPDAYLPDLAMALNNLSISLSSLGQREKALAAVQEAVVIRRPLAEKRPYAYLPDLTGSISILRDCLRAAGKFDDALAAAREAVSLLFPFFRSIPAAFGRQLVLFIRDYTQSAYEAGQEPDPALVDPIVAALIEHGFLPPPDAEPDIPAPT